MFGIFKRKTEKQVEKDNLVDEKENKGLIFIFALVMLGLLGIVMYAYHVSYQENNIYMTMITLFFIAGAIFTSSSLVGFLFGIPRTAAIDSTERSKSGYIANDNLLQVSDWITKILLGLGLTQIHQIPSMLTKVAVFINLSSKVGNQAFIILVILYFASLGFLFGYLWTRLYFTRMLRDSDIDVNGHKQQTAHIEGQISANVTTAVEGDKHK